MLYGYVAPGNGDIAGEHGFARHQVVPAAGAPVFGCVVADVEKTPVLVIEGAEVHGLQKLFYPLRKFRPPGFLHGEPRRHKPGE